MFLLIFCFREREKHGLPLVHAPNGDRTCSLGTCPEQKSNQQPLWCTGGLSNQLSHKAGVMVGVVCVCLMAPGPWPWAEPDLIIVIRLLAPLHISSIFLSVHDRLLRKCLLTIGITQKPNSLSLLPKDLNGSQVPFVTFALKNWILLSEIICSLLNLSNECICLVVKGNLFKFSNFPSAFS